MSFELKIALRYLRSKRKTGFISVITYISVAGVVIGVAALIIILSVMNGFENEVRSRFLGMDAHVRVRRYHERGFENYQALMKQIRDVPHVVAMTPYIFNKGFIKSRREKTWLLIRGIDPVTAVQVTDIGRYIVSGKMELGSVERGEGQVPLPGILLGSALAEKLFVKVGDDVTIASLSGVNLYNQLPNMIKFRVTGIFESGLHEFDENFALMSIESAQKLFHMPGKVSGIEIKLDDFNLADQVADEIENKIGYPYRALSWSIMNQNLFAWMKIQKWAGFLMLSLIILVAAFNIVSTLIMVSMEKRRDIGILKSMGATQKSIRRIFTLEGFIVGVVGTLLGSSIGYLLCWLQQTYRCFALPADVYIIGWLPILMRWSDFALIAVSAILLTWIAAMYPAHKAAQLDPVAAIRYE